MLICWCANRTLTLTEIEDGVFAVYDDDDQHLGDIEGWYSLPRSVFEERLRRLVTPSANDARVN